MKLFCLFFLFLGFLNEVLIIILMLLSAALRLALLFLFLIYALFHQGQELTPGFLSRHALQFCLETLVRSPGRGYQTADGN